MALMVSPVATSTTRLFGTRTTLLLGVGLEALALIGASFTHETWQLFLSQGVCFGFGMGFLFVGSVGVVPQWFTTKRSLANGSMWFSIFLPFHAGFLHFKRFRKDRLNDYVQRIQLHI